MPTYKPAYRLRLYKPRSEDATESAVLTPIAGAVHSDAFQVASVSGVAGYKPYLLPPTSVRRGRVYPLEKRLDVGAIVLELQDQRTTAGGTNLERWVTAFFGNTKGEIRAGGLRFELDESLDGQQTWPRFWTGRVRRAALSGRSRIRFEMRDMSDDLKMRVFVGAPHSSITYAGFMTLAPFGISVAFGPRKKTPPFTARTQDYLLAPGGSALNYVRFLSLDSVSQGRHVGGFEDNVVTQNLARHLAADQIVENVAVNPAANAIKIGRRPDTSGTARAIVKHLGGAQSGQTGTYRVGMVTVGYWGPHLYVTGVTIEALATDEPGYLALPAAGVSVEVTVVPTGPVSDKNPLFINDTQGFTLLRDLLNGKFGYLWRKGETLPVGKSLGDVKRTVAYQATTESGRKGLDDWVADTGFLPLRFIITEPPGLIDFAERAILPVYTFGWYLDTQGRVVMADLRTPTSLAGIPTIGSSDLVEGAAPDWDYDAAAGVSEFRATYYSDLPVRFSTLEAGYPLAPPALLRSLDHPFIELGIGNSDLGDREIRIDAEGFRTFAIWPTGSSEQTQNQPRDQYLQGKLREIAQHYRQPFGLGQTPIVLPCRRTTNTAAGGGDLRLLAIPELPDPATNKRGGTRLVRVVERTDEGLRRRLECLDLGIAVTAATPTLGTPAAETGNTSKGVSTSVTLNASSQPVEIHYAVTPTSQGSAPAEGSPLWIPAPGSPIRATGTFTFRGLLAGRRIWIRGRTLPDAQVEPQLPSAWVAAGAPGYADLAAYTAPSAPSVTNIGARSAKVSWTNGETILRTEIRLMTPTTDPLEHLAYADPGATSWELRGLSPSTTYRVGIRHLEDGGGETSEVTVDFTTIASGTAAPAIAGFRVV